MSRELSTAKHGATSNKGAMDVAKTLVRAGFSVVSAPADATPKATARKGVALIRAHFGTNAAFSNTGESVKLRGSHILTGRPVEFFVRVATSEGKQAGRLRHTEIEAITTTTGFDLTA